MNLFIFSPNNFPTPTKFPTTEILTASLFAVLAYLVIFVFYSSMKRENVFIVKAKDKSDVGMVIWILLAALILRIAFSYYIVGHKTDINCFTAWGDRIAQSGFKNFYASFSDYPPGYMYILGLNSTIARALGHSIRLADGSYDLVYVTLIKLPAILADLASAYLVYWLARKKMRFVPSILLMSMVAFSPVMLYISGGWGQIDQILSLFVALAIILLMSNRPITAGIAYGAAILLKPQALMAGPLLAIAYMFYVFDDSFFAVTDVKCKDKKGMRFLKTVIAVVCACAIIIISAIPFSTKELPWYQIIYEKYMGTATSYKYASVNAYNIYALFGQNWTNTEEIAFLGLNYAQVGTIGIVASVIFSAVLYIFGRKKHRGALLLAIAYLFAALFTLGHYMHERYLFPTLLLLILAYILYSDRRLLWVFIPYGITLLINCLASFYYSQYFEFGLYWDENLVFWCSLANVLIFIWFTYIVIRIMIAGKTADDVFAQTESPHPAAVNHKAKNKGKFKAAEKAAVKAKH